MILTLSGSAQICFWGPIFEGILEGGSNRIPKGMQEGAVLFTKLRQGKAGSNRSDTPKLSLASLSPPYQCLPTNQISLWLPLSLSHSLASLYAPHPCLATPDLAFVEADRRQIPDSEVQAFPTRVTGPGVDGQGERQRGGDTIFECFTQFLFRFLM